MRISDWSSDVCSSDLLAEQVDDLRLHRHVERRRRLVEHYEAWLQHHGAGDGDALALAAGELVGVAVAAVGIEADFLQRGDDHRLALVPGAAQVMDLQALGNDLADREARAERAIGILEDDPHGAAQRPQVLVRSEEHTSELQSLMRNSYAVFCLKKKNYKKTTQ